MIIESVCIHKQLLPLYFERNARVFVFLDSENDSLKSLKRAFVVIQIESTKYCFAVFHVDNMDLTASAAQSVAI